VNGLEREVVIDLRLELEQRVRSCPGCLGAGRLRSGRPCPLCRRARQAIAASEPLLLPTCEPVRQLDAFSF
jgi:hypothetical protein